MNCIIVACGILLAISHSALSQSLYSATSDVVQLTQSNFQDKVINSKDVWLVEFYAPWCGHCKTLAPEWDKAATALRGIVRIGAVDMTAHQSVGAPYNVKGFPTIKVFGEDKNSPSDYQGARTAEAITGEALKAARDAVDRRLRKKGSGGSSGGGGGSGGGGSGGGQKDVVELTDSNFQEKVLNSEEPWLVEFFAPWCGHCKNLAPEWAKAASQLKGKMNLGALDATVHPGIAGRYGIRGYPTIKYFPAGKKSGDAEEYDGGRTSGDIVNWAMDKAAENMPPPEVLEVTSSEVLKGCFEKPLCMVAVLPDILDTGAVGRNKYLGLLREMGDKYKKKEWGYVWAAAGNQALVEEALGIGGFGYPAMAAVNSRKMKYSIFRGSFSQSGINEYFRDLSFGKGSSSPVRGGEIPVAKKREPWDGKDGEIPIEEDYDLSDIDMDEDTKKDEL